MVVLFLLIFKFFFILIMVGKRGQKISRGISIDEVKREVASRNHTLIQYTVGKTNAEIIPKSSAISLKCNKCGYEWTTSAGGYFYKRKAPSGGCRGCYNKNVINPEIYPNSPCLPAPAVPNRPKRREGRQRLHEAHLAGQYGFIQNREQLVQYFEKNPNSHNSYVLELVQRDARAAKESGILTGLTVKHHVLPLFDQGSPNSWNLVEVSTEEHMKIHTLRYEVYGKDGDRKAIYGTTSDFIRSSSDSDDENSNSPIPNQRVKVNWGVLRRIPEVTLAIETGMVWTHRDGFSCTILPNSVYTVKEIIAQLINALPEDHPDSVRLQTSPSVANYIRHHIETVFPVPREDSRAKGKKSAYNFTVAPLPK